MFADQSDRENHIAIIGMAGRFPGAKNLDEFWRNLRDGVEAISYFSEQELLATGIEPTILQDPYHIRAGAVLEDIDQFDAAFFDFSPRQAELTDPQHRLFLECAWEALESAGYDPSTYKGLIGIYAGSNISNYLLSNLYPVLGFTGTIGNLQTLIGNDKDYLATHVSYKLNLRGPSVSVQTACSTSLVAVHLACQSLLNRECDMALAGAAAVRVPQKTGYFYQEGGIFSPDGHCRPFDAHAQGTIFGNGLGIVVLKRLIDAIEEGDRIEAVILGSAINNDGSFKIGYTAPSEQGQAEVIAEALAMADVEPETITFIETHGTGTPLGDPIEVAALHQTFRMKTNAKGSVALGAVKSNLGHLESAAGIAGLIKTILALQHKQIPPTLHFSQPNPNINFADSPFYVNHLLQEWQTGPSPRRAGVSSFGIGGTNVHLILEEAPPNSSECAASSQTYLLPLSARTQAGLQDLARSYREFLADPERGASQAISDICYTAAVRRRHFQHRTAIKARSHQEFIQQLAAYLDQPDDASHVFVPAMEGKLPKIVFVFPGQGAQWVGMGRQLLQQEPIFRETLERCDQALSQYVNWSLLDVLVQDEKAGQLEEIDVIQPVLFAIQAGLAAYWISKGIHPDVVVGHSMGEVAAAYVAGILSLEDAIRIISQRSHLLKGLSGKGAMAVVGLTVEQAQAQLSGYEASLSIAVSNSPTSTVISGDAAELKRFVADLEARGIFCRWIKVDVASHSPQVDCLRTELLQKLGSIHPNPANIKMISTVTGQAVGEGELGADYWMRNLRKPVQFSNVIQQLLESEHQIFLEISPHPILLPAIEDSLYHFGKTGFVLPSLRRDTEEQSFLLETLGSLYTLGLEINWTKVHPEGQCVRLPAYPWQRQRYWLEPTKASHTNWPTTSMLQSDKQLHPLLGQQLRTALKETLFVNQLYPGSLPFLADHRVCGQILFPVTAYLEMAWATHHVVDTHDSRVLGNLVLYEPLLLGNDPQTMQLILTPDENKSSIQIFSQVENGELWRLHMSGEILAEKTAGISASAVSLEKAKICCQQEFPAATFYEHLRSLGYEYGPSFQGILKIWRGEKETLGLVRLPEAVAHEVKAYTVHPSLLDACMQLLGLTLTGDDQNSLYLPVGVAKYQVYVSPGEQAWGYAVLRSDHKEETPVGDIYLFNESGELCVEVTGLTLKRTSQAALQRSFKSRREDWLYQLTWQQKPRSDAKLPITTPRNWLIFADRAGVNQALASQLAEKGETSTLVLPGQEYQVQDDHLVVVNPDQPEDMQRLLASGASWDEILYLWSLDTTSNPQTTSVSLLEDQKIVCGGLLHLVQALAQANLPSPLKLWLVTQGVQPVENTNSQLNVTQASLWGLGRVIALEHPELNCRMIDLDATNITQSVQELVAEIVSGDREDQIAFRKHDRYVLRLTPYKTKNSSSISEGKSVTVDEPVQLSIYERGMFDNLVLEPAPRGSPGAGEVEIRVYATGLNFRDVLDALGMCPVEAGPLGSECAGQISAIGEGVSGWHVGDEVLAIAPGAFRTFVTVPADFVALKPPNISFEEAATIPVTFLTAYYGLCHLAQMKAGDRVLIHAAAGGVGLAAIQLAKQSGAEVFATAGTPEKRAFLKSMGIKHIMNSRTLDFADEIMAVTNGQGVDIVLNSLAGDFIPRSLSALGENGRFVEIGKIDIWDPNQVKEVRPDVSYFFFDLATEGFKNPPLIKEIFRNLLEAFSLGTLAPLPRQVFSVTEIVNAFRTMAQAKHIGKIVVTQEQKRSRETLELFHPESSYLVTGGLGNLGFFVAQWMAQQGARNLVLVGRSAPSDHVCEAISALEKSGVKVLVMQADVSQEDQVREVLANIAQSMPELRGIIHAAGVLEDGILLRQNWERFATVLSSKVQGSWNLHILTSHLPLDFFVMFSSTASLLGSAGQGNYAAANSFMDILAHARRLQGLPALSINWAGWSEIGLAARQNNLERGLAFGLEAIPPEQGLQILEQALRQEVTQIAALPINWQKFMQQFSPSNKPSLFADFSQPESSLQNISIGKSELYKKLEATAPQNRQQALVTFMSEQVRKVLGLKPGFFINVQQPLKELGLDSLMAIELRNSLARALGRPLPATLLFNHPTLDGLAAHILSTLPFTPAETAATSRPKVSEAIAKDQTQLPLDQLPVEALEARLAEELEALEDLINENSRE